MPVEIVTFGCRLNAFESEVIAREAENAGLERTIVINSCAVTNEAVAQARQSIRRLKRERPDARIVVTGCAAQTQAAMFANVDSLAHHFYFSPGAVEIASDLIARYSGAECAKPEVSDLVLLVGNPGWREAIFPVDSEALANGESA